MQQVYVPKKVEVPVVSLPRTRPQSVITVGFMEVPITNHDGPIVIEEILGFKQDEAPKEVAGVKEKKRIEGDSKYRQPICYPRGLNKTQRRKLQCARHKQQKREKLVKREVGMEVPEVPDEEMVDYEAILERVDVNVVYMSVNYYILGDDSATAEFNFMTESAIFQKPDDFVNHLKPPHVKLIDNWLNIIM
ncbi:unnamed protein product [Miscanthus lutarioriparius]|uniref:Uncharacterized protein n=1 Tax=Miscanthus lutarioriparius TaxID=422564 RepID=A0A811NPX3_9POAL|nr:unnamed protein product [Miscanthus lutarioriparius]